MAKQIPYCDFDEAYILLLNTLDHDKFRKFIDVLKKNNIIKTFGYKSCKLYIPFDFIFEPTYTIFWQCLCRMYGNMFKQVTQSYIYSDNLYKVIAYLETVYNTIKEVDIPEIDPENKLLFDWIGEQCE